MSALAGAPWQDWAHWANLLDETPPPAPGKGHLFPAEIAREHARRLPLSSYETVVLLGRRVAGAVLPGGDRLPWFDPVDVDGARLVVIPHPSGIVRWWNDPANRERAAALLTGLARLS